MTCSSFLTQVTYGERSQVKQNKMEDDDLAQVVPDIKHITGMAFSLLTEHRSERLVSSNSKRKVMGEVVVLVVSPATAEEDKKINSSHFPSHI
jgi:hypothetical protein